MARQQPNGATATPARNEPKSPADAIRTMLESTLGRLDEALPAHLTPERVVQVVTTLVYRTPRLQQCDRGSILASVMRASSLGLDLEPAMGEAYLIPRWNGKTQSLECQFQIGYQGLRRLAMNTGAVAYIQARLVYSRDRFFYEFDPDLKFLHQPHLGAGRGEVVLVYAVGKLVTGDHLIEAMDVDEVEAIHRRSESYRTAQKDKKAEEGPWATDWGEMARKTVTKRLCKSLPRSLELAKAIEEDNASYEAEARGPGLVAPRPTSKSAALADRLESRGLPGPDEPEFAEGTAGAIRSEADDEGRGTFPDEMEPREPGADG